MEWWCFSGETVVPEWRGKSEWRCGDRMPEWREEKRGQDGGDQRGNETGRGDRRDHHQALPNGLPCK